MGGGLLDELGLVMARMLGVFFFLTLSHFSILSIFTFRLINVV